MSVTDASRDIFIHTNIYTRIYIYIYIYICVYMYKYATNSGLYECDTVVCKKKIFIIYIEKLRS